MSRITKILVATDFSPHSTAAEHCAAELAGRLDVPLVVYNAVFLPVYPIPDGVVLRSPDVMAELVQKAQSHLDASKKAAQEYGARRVEAHWTEGPAAHEIVRVARDLNVDMVVVGTHGRGVVARAILGSTADRVIRSAHCPVLVVTHEY